MLMVPGPQMPCACGLQKAKVCHQYIYICGFSNYKGMARYGVQYRTGLPRVPGAIEF